MIKRQFKAIFIVIKDITTRPYGSDLQPPDRDDTSVFDAFIAFSAVLLYLQYLGVILVETVNFGLFGEIMNVLVIFASLFDLSDLTIGLQGAYLILISLSFLPVFIVFTLSSLSRSINEDIEPKGIYSSKAFYFSFLILLAGLVLVIFSLFVGDSNFALIFIISTIYWLIGSIINYTSILKLFKEDRFQIFFLRSLLVLCLIPYVSLFINFLLSSSLFGSQDDALFSDIGIFFMLFVIVYLIIFELQFLNALSDKSSFLEDQPAQISIWCKLTGGDFSNKEQCFRLRTMFHPTDSIAVLQFQYLFFIERLLMGLVGGLSGSNDFYDNLDVVTNFNATETQRENIPLIGLMTILGTMSLLLILRRPFKSFSLNFLQLFPRLSHFLLVLLTFLEDRYSGPVSTTVFYFTLFIISILFFCSYFKPEEHIQEIRDETGEVCTSCFHFLRKPKYKILLQQLKTDNDNKIKQEILRDELVTYGLWDGMRFTQRIDLLQLVEPKSKAEIHTTTDIFNLKEFYKEYYSDGLSLLKSYPILEISEGVQDFIQSYETDQMTTLFESLESVRELHINSKEKDINMNNVIRCIFQYQNIFSSVLLRFKEYSGNFVPPIIDFLKNEDTSITELNLSGNDLNINDIELILRTMNKNKSIRVLDLSFNNDSWANFEDLSDVYASLITNKTLEVLRMKNNYLKYESLHELIKAAKKEKTLKELDITEQRLGGDMSSAIATKMIELLDVYPEIELWTSREYLQRQTSYTKYCC